MTELQKLLLNSIRSAHSFERLSQGLETARPGKAIGVKGLRGSSFSGVLAALATTPASTNGKANAAIKRHPLVVVVTGNYERSAEIYDDMQFFGIERAFHYPKTQVLPYDDDEPLLEEQVKHLEFLHHLVDCATPDATCTQSAVCSTSIEALFTRVAPLEHLKQLILRIDWGQTLDPEQFAGAAADLGFERVPTVEARGEFAIRGGILDIFPLDAENPFRIDLFGDEIESIRAFDVHTQRSLRGSDNIERLTILPARESVLIQRALGHEPQAELPVLPTLLDVLPADTLLVFDHPEVYQVLDDRFRQLVERQHKEHSKERTLPAPTSLFATLDQVQKTADRFTQIHHSLVIEGVARTGITFETNSFETTKPSLEYYITQIRKRVADGYTVGIICDNDGQAQRMDEMLRENVIGSAVIKEDGTGRLAANADTTRDVIVAVGLLHSGFILPEGSLYLVTDREIFGRYKRRHVYRKIYKGAPIADAREIRKGDYVVHLEHGVGRFEGIRTQNVDGKVTDFVELVYADDDKLLVPVEKIAYVQKFSGPDQAAPTLDKLGSKKWTQRRQKSEEDVKKLAGELLQLHARRAAARGHSFGDDSLWQREFESSFLYSETPDQMRAIDDVKRDMASDKPMDRLVCGDVGYGKTEVAIRAAFKAISDKKQVALLCPTTILARQHYDNFRERFADYPFKVEMLSRFRTPKETREALKGLADGSVNLVIGTHQLLSKSVQFKDLGLVIVDEEQRFGVSHKERLKELRASVDFLTLTATPIPRTLYMALSGLRDMSVINTPPVDRHPIKTKIIHWDREQIEEAILRELNRGGQVFFVHNRVQNINAIAEKIREIVPSARIVVAHGQMNEHDLEQIILDFIDQKYDILVSTTIIESGIDIPNVNTIIINRADAFGLAQLYQLRGRVGRENRRAYAYLVVPAGQAITEHAVARLQAIEEFTELGVGFNIAMRDMEIRGTGNLLGKEQHGSMNAVGFELYCKMLEEAVEEMRGQQREEEARDVEIQWKASAYVPPDFVPVESQRVMLYKRIAEARTLEELDEIAAEVRDRYGEVPRTVPGACDVKPLKASAGPQGPHAMPSDPGSSKVAVAVAGAKRTGTSNAKPAAAVVEDLPEAVDNLFNIARMRMLGRKLELRKVQGLKNGFKLHRPGVLQALGPRAQKLIKGGNPQIFADDPNALELSYKDWDCRRPLSEAVSVLQKLQA
jgi:transcription-repair coupling factor (superfamily II helicase)